MKVVEHKPGWHRHEVFQSEQRLRTIGHRRNRLFRSDVKAADEGCQSTPQSGHSFMCAGEYPYFAVYFACPGENLKIAGPPFSCAPGISTVECERYVAGRRSNPPPIGG